MISVQQLGSKHGPCFVGPDFGINCLQMLSADKTGKQRVKFHGMLMDVQFDNINSISNILYNFNIFSQNQQTWMNVQCLKVSCAVTYVSTLLDPIAVTVLEA